MATIDALPPKTEHPAPPVRPVLHVRVVSGEGGGPEKTILNSPRFLEGFGYQAACVYLHPEGDPGFAQIRRLAEKWNAPLIAIPDRGPLDFRVVRRLLEVCRSQQTAIWHGHDYKSNALGLVLRRFWPMRLVTTVHGWVKFTRRTPLYYAVDRYCLRRYERVICVSPDLVDQCLAARTPRRNCVLIENAIDTEEYQRRWTTAEAKRRLGLAPDRLLIGAIGRLSEEKGFDLLIRCVHRLLEEGLDCELAIVGAGDQEAHLTRLIAESGRGDRIRLLGYRTDVPELLQAFDLFALSSLREGLPNVVLEAMSLETPVVSTSVAGLVRLIQDGENGLLVPPANEAELTGALRRMLLDGELRRRLAVAGRRTIEERHSFARRMEKMRALYAELFQHES